ncbi:PEX29 Peroxisomal membrane protein PEX29 [Candida maltosa Xu316]
MEQVSSILTNILSIEEDHSSSSKNSSPQQRSSNRSSLESTDMSTPNSKKPQRRSLDLDFSSFWRKDDKEQAANISHSSSISAAATATSMSTQSSSAQQQQAPPPPVSSSVSSASYMADKLVEKVISVMVSNEVVDERTSRVLQERIQMQKQRPSLSIALMQTNSNELHRRNSNMYIFMDYVEKFFNWQNAYYTIGMLLIITHMILNPYLLTVVPLLHFIATTLVPHYMMIYQPDTNYNAQYWDVNPIPSDKPLSSYKVPQPAPLFSKEYFMNLTDTQNFMTLNIKMFDFGVWLTSDYLYFKNEQITSVIYLVCLGLMIGNLYLLPVIVPILLNHFIVVKLCLIFNIWATTIILHPTIRGTILEWVYKEDTRLNFQQYMNMFEDKLAKFLVKTPTVDQHTEEPEENNDIKYVEIYELQKMNTKTKIWELVGFTPNFYTTNSVVRRYNNAISQIDSDSEDETEQVLNLSRKETLAEINPPQNYKFLDSIKWKIDYDINSWVQNNLIQDLVIIDDDEKWAYDVITDDVDDNVSINQMSMNEIEKMTNTEFYRRRRWIRKVIRMTYKDKKESSSAPSGLSAWV